MESGAAAELGIHIDLAIVFADDGIGAGEAQTAGVFTGGKIGIENPGQDFGLDAHAEIAHQNFHVLARAQRRQKAGGEFHVLGAHFDFATVGHGLDGIEHDVVDDLAELAFVHIHGPKIRREGKFAMDIAPMQGEERRLAKAVGELNARANRRAATGKHDELLRQIPWRAGRIFPSR